jgi:hypothetical protein
MANGNMSRRTSSSAPSQKNNTKPVKTRKEVMDKISSLEKEMQSQYSKAKELLEE